MIPFLKELMILVLALSLIALVAPAAVVSAQEIVDKTVAVVEDGVRSELITLSDLRWQLALQPGVSLSPVAPADLQRALQLQIDQRLIALEAQRLPANAPTDSEISAAIAELISYFPSAADFEQRLRSVGFDSIRDTNFEQMIRQRIAIQKYLDFRFRSFIVVTPEDETAYFREIFAPDFRRKYPGVLMPTLEEKRADINVILTEERVEAAITAFLDEAKRRTDVVILSEV